MLNEQGSGRTAGSIARPMTDSSALNPKQPEPSDALLASPFRPSSKIVYRELPVPAQGASAISSR